MARFLRGLLDGKLGWNLIIHMPRFLRRERLEQNIPKKLRRDPEATSQLDGAEAVQRRTQDGPWFWGIRWAHGAKGSPRR